MEKQKRLSSLITTIALFVSMGYSASAASFGDETDFWKSSGITLQDFILDEAQNCSQDAVHVLACLKTLNALGSLLNHPVIYVHREELNQNLVSVGVMIKPISSHLLLYALPSRSIPETRTLRTKRAALIESKFDELKTLPFKPLFENLAKQLEASSFDESLASIAAYTYNTYLAVAVDPHTRIDTVESLNQDWSGESDARVGVGLVLNRTAGIIRVAYDLPESPAEKAKIYRGDVLLELDGHPVKSAQRKEIDSWMNGAPGSVLKLSVMRGTHRLDFSLVRAVMDAPSLSYSVVNRAAQSFGLIQIRNFMDTSLERQFREALVDLQDHLKVKSLILDLRGNTGGRMDAVLEIANDLLGAKNIVGLDIDHDGSIEWSKPKSRAILGKMPVVALIDAQSASASEILAGALQDYSRAFLLGERSYGKGTAQMPDHDYPLVRRNPKIVMYRTYSPFYLPSGRTNQRWGIEPDFAVEAYPGELINKKRVEPQREEDLYLDSPILTKKWQQTRPGAIAEIERCRRNHFGSKDSALKRYQTPPFETTRAPDYRLWVAEDVLSCVLLTQKLVE